MRSVAPSWLSKADPRVKLIWFLSVALVALAPVDSFTLTVLVSVPAIAFLAGVHRDAPWLTVLAAPAFLLLLALGSVIADPSCGLLPVVALILRWGAIIYGAIFFSFATQSHEIHFLTRWARLPKELSIALCFAARTVPITLEQLSGLVRAMRVRGLWPFSWSFREVPNALILLPHLLLALLVSAAGRTEQMWVALELRGGWEGSPTFFISRNLPASLMLLSHGTVMAFVAGLSVTKGI